MGKLRDLVVVTGTYESNGETKKRYENIGALMESNDGGQYIMLKRTFNPAGVPNPENRDSVLVGMFESNRDQQRPQASQQQGQQYHQQQQQQASQNMQAPGSAQPADFDSDIPF